MEEKFKELKELYEQEKKREAKRQEIEKTIAKLEQKKRELERKLQDAEDKETGQYVSESPDIREVG